MDRNIIKKNLFRFFSLITFTLIEEWLGFGDFLQNSIRSLGYCIRSFGFHAIPRLVSVDANGLLWAVHFVA